MRCLTSATSAYVTKSVANQRATFYLYINSTPSVDCCICGSQSETGVFLTTARKLDLRINSVSKDLGTNVLDTGTWYRVSIGIDGDNGKIYLDGIEECSAADAGFDVLAGTLGVRTSCNAISVTSAL
jgi:hypothetical protein